MDGSGKSNGPAIRWISVFAVLALSLAVAGCGAVAGVGSAVASGAEAVGTLVKDSMKDEDKEKGEAEAKPAKPE